LEQAPATSRAAAIAGSVQILVMGFTPGVVGLQGSDQGQTGAILARIAHFSDRSGGRPRMKLLSIR
jgi:hypothetical protein